MPCPPKAKTRVLDDPLHAQAADRASEQLVTGACQGEFPRGLVAAGLGPVQWLAVQLTDIDSDSRRRSRYSLTQGMYRIVPNVQGT